MVAITTALIEEGLILLGTVGSHAYGINTPTSDLDIKGICVRPASHYWGLTEFKQKDKGWHDTTLDVIKAASDCTVYDIIKYVALAANCNPNILELLWLSEYHILKPSGQLLIENRNIFLSKKVRSTYMGYAFAQLSKIETHRKWLLKPVEEPPVVQGEWVPLTKGEENAFLEFLYILIRDAIEYMEPSEELKALLLERVDYKGLLKQHPLPPELDPLLEKMTRSSKDFLGLLHKTQEYRRQLADYENYQSWLKTRNPARAATEAAIGYDTKHAAHLVRLLKSGKEILETGNLTVNRREAGDADLLMSIRNCEISYEDLMKLTEELKGSMESAYEGSSLPAQVDMEAINELCVKAIRMSATQENTHAGVSEARLPEDLPR